MFEVLIGIAIFSSFFITELSTIKKKDIDEKSDSTQVSVENVASDRAPIGKIS